MCAQKDLPVKTGKKNKATILFSFCVLNRYLESEISNIFQLKETGLCHV